MDTNQIEEKMHMLETIIEYKFNNISYLSKAMCSKLVEVPGKGKNNKEYSNEALAQVGDTLLKFIITDNLFGTEINTKAKINDDRQKIENNENMNLLLHKEKIIDYAYNEKHFLSDSNIPNHEKVVSKEHNAYLEAIIAAIYYDSNYEKARNWIVYWLLPRLYKYAKKEL